MTRLQFSGRFGLFEGQGHNGASFWEFHKLAETNLASALNRN
jgi:hypothetical protein